MELQVLPPPDHVGTAVAPVVNTAAATMTATLQDVGPGVRSGWEKGMNGSTGRICWDNGGFSGFVI